VLKKEKMLLVVLSTYTINKRLPEPLQLLKFFQLRVNKSGREKMVADIGSSVFCACSSYGKLRLGEVAEF